RYSIGVAYNNIYKSLNKINNYAELIKVNCLEVYGFHPPPASLRFSRKGTSRLKVKFKNYSKVYNYEQIKSHLFSRFNAFHSIYFSRRLRSYYVFIPSCRRPSLEVDS
ncbi:MAG: hypothetical protein ACPK85_03400, partial [Methanosarcina sp.]